MKPTKNKSEIVMVSTLLTFQFHEIAHKKIDKICIGRKPACE